jgi:hypothetical protein
MKPGFISIPFKIEGDNMARGTGIAKFSPVGIVMEFETSFLGFINHEFKDIRIPMSEIMDVKLVHGLFNTNFEKFFHTRIHIRLNNYQTMSAIPNKKGRIIMHIHRRDRDLADLALAALEEQTPQLPGPNEQELPPAPGVRALFGDEADTKELE